MEKFAIPLAGAIEEAMFVLRRRGMPRYSPTRDRAPHLRPTIPAEAAERPRRFGQKRPSGNEHRMKAGLIRRKEP